MAELDRRGSRIFYAVSGIENELTPVLLTHGFLSSSSMWDASVGPLSAARRVITWDLRGHGRSASPSDSLEYTAACCVEDMRALLDACGAGRAVLGGQSLGGYLSLEFFLRWPERVAGLVLVSTGPGFRSDQARQRWNDRQLRLAARIERDGLAALGDGDLVRRAGHRSARGLELAARHLVTQHDARVIDALGSVSVPVLVVVGELDSAFRPAAEYLAAKIGGAELAVLGDAGHACNVDRPAEFNRRVLAFLRRVDRG